MRYRSLLGSVVAVALLAFAAAAAPEAPQYDLVLRNGRVLDGAGNPWISADIAIQQGRIVKIGKIEGKGKKELDAAGHYVAPGFIDMMDQSGNVLLTHGLAENKLRQGVTTAIGGEGGTPASADKILEYFATLEKKGISLNFGSYYSEAQARRAVLGADLREPKPEELEKMKALMETAMRGGAMGMSTALIYPPGSYATTSELIEVARVAGRYGGIYASHIRGEGKNLSEAIKEAIEVGERGGLPVEIFHLKAAHQPGWGTLMREAGSIIDQARARGVDVAADLYVYTAGSTGLEATIPSWAHAGGDAALLKRLADPAIRARLKQELQTGSPGWWNIVEASGGWDGVVLTNAHNPNNSRWHGKSLAHIAKALKKDPADVAFDLVAQGDGRVSALYHMMCEPDIETALRFPWTSIGSDGGASRHSTPGGSSALSHPRANGNFVRVLAHYVRERKVLTLEDAVRKMTSWPATRMRLANRGLIKEGQWADVVIFDFEKIQDRATYEQPLLPPEGIDYVLVNGQLVIDHGRHTGERPGRVLYGPGYVPAEPERL